MEKSGEAVIRKVRHAAYTFLLLGSLLGGILVANQSQGSAALLVACGLAISGPFGILIQGAVAGLQLRQEGHIEMGSIIVVPAVDGPRVGKVIAMRWRVTLIECANGDHVPIPNATLTAAAPPVLAQWPVPPAPLP